MFEEMNTIVLSGKEYPMKCDNLVLEKIQDKYEDLGKYENMLNGFVPELDEYGEEVRNEDGLLVGHYKMPDIKIINEAAVWFIQEGLAIKRDNHAGEGGEPEPINFAWVVLIGMRIGYTEKEVAHMYFDKWCDLFEEFKKMHNITMRRQVFEQQKIASMMDL